MASSNTILDFSAPVVRVRCEEPEGTFIREVRFAPLSVSRLKEYYNKLSKFEVLFNHYIANDVDAFIHSFVHIDAAGNIVPNGLIWEVDDVGLLYMTEISPEYQAKVHFTFWDRRLRGREPIIQEMIKWSFKTFGFRRLVAEIPLYATPAILMAEKVGFKKEGRMRSAAYYRGKWFDMNLYSILREEVLDEHEAKDSDS